MGGFRRNVYFKDSEMLDLVRQFLVKQKNYSDSIMFLIEQEIARKGVRNLGNFINRERSREYWDSSLNVTGSHNVPPSLPAREMSSVREPVESPGVFNADSPAAAVNPFRVQKDDSDQVEIPSCYDDAL